jgi:hypothetical protein
MNEIELTRLFVDYAESLKKSAELKSKIEAAVLERGETVKIAGISASYYKASFETPDYKGVARAVMPKDFNIMPFSTTTVSTRWKEICEYLSIDVPAGAEKPARVVVSG